MANIEELKAMRIGCDGAVWAPLTLDNGTAVPVYGEVVSLPGVMAININPNSSIETAFYDDGPGEVATTLGNIEVTFNKSALSPKEKARLLGKAYTASGLLIHGTADTPPWGAFGFRTLKSDGTYKYVWLYKGKFIDPADNNETKGESINFQSDEMTGRFVKLNYKATINGKQKQLWKTEWDEMSTATVELRNKIRDKWFTAVVTPGKTNWDN